MSDSHDGFKNAPPIDLNAPGIQDFLGEASAAGDTVPAASSGGTMDMTGRLELVLGWMAEMESELEPEPGGSPDVRLRALMHLHGLITELNHRSLSLRLVLARQAAMILGSGGSQAAEAGGQQADVIRMAVEAGIDRHSMEAWSGLAGLGREGFAAVRCAMQLRQRGLQDASELESLVQTLSAKKDSGAAAICGSEPESSPGPISGELEAALQNITEAVKTAEDSGWQYDSKDALRRRLDLLEHMLALGDDK